MSWQQSWQQMLPEARCKIPTSSSTLTLSKITVWIRHLVRLPSPCSSSPNTSFSLFIISLCIDGSTWEYVSYVDTSLWAESLLLIRWGHEKRKEISLRHRTLRTSACSSSEVFRGKDVAGSKCLHNTFMVIAMLLCPNISWTIFGWPPILSRRVAALWRRSWKRISGNFASPKAVWMVGARLYLD